MATEYSVKRVGTGYFVVDEKGAVVDPKCYAGQRGKKVAEAKAKLLTSRFKIGNLYET